MKLLLDTHVLVWAESLDEHLGPQTRTLLINPANTLLVSPVSSLELSRLISLSRLVLRNSLQEWLEQAHKHLGFEEASISHKVAMESYRLPGEFHRDLVDRILVATARILGCTLLTADERILSYPHVNTLDARC